MYTHIVCEPVILNALDIRPHYYGASALFVCARVAGWACTHTLCHGLPHVSSLVATPDMLGSQERYASSVGLNVLLKWCLPLSISRLNPPGMLLSGAL
jgi:hypothetical protein